MTITTWIWKTQENILRLRTYLLNSRLEKALAISLIFSCCVMHESHHAYIGKTHIYEETRECLVCVLSLPNKALTRSWRVRPCLVSLSCQPRPLFFYTILVAKLLVFYLYSKERFYYIYIFIHKEITKTIYIPYVFFKLLVHSPYMPSHSWKFFIRSCSLIFFLLGPCSDSSLWWLRFFLLFSIWDHIRNSFIYPMVHAKCLIVQSHWGLQNHNIVNELSYYVNFRFIYRCGYRYCSNQFFG